MLQSASLESCLERDLFVNDTRTEVAMLLKYDYTSELDGEKGS